MHSAFRIQRSIVKDLRDLILGLTKSCRLDLMRSDGRSGFMGNEDFLAWWSRQNEAKGVATRGSLTSGSRDLVFSIRTESV